MSKKKSELSGIKLLLFFGISVIIAIVAIIVVSLKVFERDFIKSTNSELENISHGIFNTVEAWGRAMRGNALIISSRSDVVEAVRNKDHISLYTLLFDFAKATPSDFILFTDEHGIVMASNAPFVKAYSDISYLGVVQNALQGKNSMRYEPVGKIPFAGIFSSPIRDFNGKVVGSVVICYDIMGRSFVDLIHGYGIECTVFRYDRRIASSLEDVVGTKVNNPVVEETVLKNGHTFVGSVRIKGTDYYSVYSPVFNDDKSIAGMIFVAKEHTVIKVVTRGILHLVLPICLFIALALITALLKQTVHDRLVLKQKADLLLHQLNWDVLTNANTRQFGMNELSHCFDNYKLGLPGPVIMMLDVDNFKGVNDTYGHEAGDEVLKKIVGAVYKNCRSNDKIIRWGGDEFVGIFEGMKYSSCKSFASKILESVSKVTFVSGDSTFNVTVSIGFTSFKPTDNSYEDALARADSALYCSKVNGKNAMFIDL